MISLLLEIASTVSLNLIKAGSQFQKLQKYFRKLILRIQFLLNHSQNQHCIILDFSRETVRDNVDVGVDKNEGVDVNLSANVDIGIYVVKGVDMDTDVDKVIDVDVNEQM